MNIEQKYENNTLPEILAELRQVNRRRNGEPVYDLFEPSKDPDGPCKVLPQSLGDIADRIERAAKDKLAELRELLAEMREDIEDSSWMEEYPIIDEDGYPDDCGCHVVRRLDVYDWIDRLSAAIDPAAPPTK